MQGMLLLIRAFLPEEESAALAAYYRRMARLVDKVDGFFGASLWRDAAETDEYLLIAEYRDQGAAEAGLRALAEEPLLAEEVHSVPITTDVARVVLLGREGKRPAQTEMGSFVSISRRMSAPGYGDDLANEIERIFGELSVIPGYAGAAWGTNEAIAEQVVGIVVWTGREAYEASLPPGILHDVQLFRKAL